MFTVRIRNLSAAAATTKKNEKKKKRGHIPHSRIIPLDVYLFDSIRYPLERGSVLSTCGFAFCRLFGFDVLNSSCALRFLPPPAQTHAHAHTWPVIVCCVVLCCDEPFRILVEVEVLLGGAWQHGWGG